MRFFNTMDNIKELYKQKQKLESEVAKWNEKINKYTPDKPFNLLSDEIRTGEQYKQEKRMFELSFLQLQQFNQSLTTKEKRQLRDMKRSNKNGQTHTKMDSSVITAEHGGEAECARRSTV